MDSMAKTNQLKNMEKQINFVCAKQTWLNFIQSQ